jgi:hypothetical protein
MVKMSKGGVEKVQKRNVFLFELLMGHRKIGKGLKGLVQIGPHLHLIEM